MACARDAALPFGIVSVAGAGFSKREMFMPGGFPDAADARRRLGRALAGENGGRGRLLAHLHSTTARKTSANKGKHAGWNSTRATLSTRVPPHPLRLNTPRSSQRSPRQGAVSGNPPPPQKSRPTAKDALALPTKCPHSPKKGGPCVFGRRPAHSSARARQAGGSGALGHKAEPGLPGSGGGIGEGGEGRQAEREKIESEVSRVLAHTRGGVPS